MNNFFLLLIISTLFCAEFKTQRQYKIEQQLHAPCCWGGVIAEHDSPFANGIKTVIKNILSEEFNIQEINSALLQVYKNNVLEYANKNIKQNMTNEEIVNFFVGIEGEKMRALPENKGLGWIAWKLPTFVLILSLIISFIIINKFRSVPQKKYAPINGENQYKKVDNEMKKMGF
jgi:cytochrome c-type biogenesis protein CcmH/NrfF